MVVGLVVIQRTRATTHHQRHHFRRVRDVWWWNNVVIHRHQITISSVQRVAARRVHMIHLGVGGHVVRQGCRSHRVI